MELLGQALSSSNEWRGVYLFTLSVYVLAPIFLAVIIVLLVPRIKPKAIYGPIAVLVGLAPSSFTLGVEYSNQGYMWLFVLPGMVLFLIMMFIYLITKKLLLLKQKLK